MFFFKTTLSLILALSIVACNHKPKDKKKSSTPYTSSVLAVDSSKIFLEDFNNQIADYIGYLWSIEAKQARIEQENLLSLAAKYDKDYPQSKTLEIVAERMENMLYYPNSPSRNEELFLPIAEYMSSYSKIDSLSRERYKKIAKNCSINRIGEVVADFRYATLKDGESSLHKIKSDYIFIFFSNPGCNSCFDIIQQIKSSEKISLLQEKGKLTILNMYIDEDLSNWAAYMKEYPTNWINAYDPNAIIKNNNLYYIRAIPSIYILDKEKRAILKDAPEHIAIGFLESLNL